MKQFDVVDAAVFTAEVIVMPRRRSRKASSPAVLHITALVLFHAVSSILVGPTRKCPVREAMSDAKTVADDDPDTAPLVRMMVVGEIASKDNTSAAVDSGCSNVVSLTVPSMPCITNRHDLDTIVVDDTHIVVSAAVAPTRPRRVSCWKKLRDNTVIDVAPETGVFDRHTLAVLAWVDVCAKVFASV